MIKMNSYHANHENPNNYSSDALHWRLQMINKKYKHSALTEKIINCAMQVHSVLGNGFQEVIYQRALAIEMEMQGLPFKREHEIEIYYKGQYVGTRRADFLVDNKVMVEIKALVALEDVHLAQAINYCEAYNIEVGLLINFGAKSLEFKRVHNRKSLEL
jgi:GxxExxY protein